MPKTTDDQPVLGKPGKYGEVASKGWLTIFMAIRPMLFRIVRRMVRPEEIEDIVQETFILSYAASRKKRINNPGAFMLQTAKNIALNTAGRADRKLHFSFENMPDEDFITHMGSVEERYQAREMFLHFCRAVSELPIECRRVFILKKVYGLTQDEIAKRVSISVSMVEKHVARGMAMTGRYMVTQGYWDESKLASSGVGHKDREAR